MDDLDPIVGRRIASGEVLVYQVRKYTKLDPAQERLVLRTAEIVELEIDAESLAEIDVDYLGPERTEALRTLAGRRFDRHWKLEDALARSPAWAAREPTPINQLYNKDRSAQLGYVFETFRVVEEEEEDFP